MQAKRRLSVDEVSQPTLSLHECASKACKSQGAVCSFCTLPRITTATIASNSPSRDIISTLPAEVLVRIMSNTTEHALIEASAVSRLFYQITSDCELWRTYYYRRFILPGLSYKRQHAYKAKLRNNMVHNSVRRLKTSGCCIDWKKRYKLRYNWEKGSCHMSSLPWTASPISRGRTLLKVIDGLAIVADAGSGLTVWDLGTSTLMANIAFDSYNYKSICPTCLAVDDNPLEASVVGIAIGFEDGTFGTWKLELNIHTRKDTKLENSTNALVQICRYETEGSESLEDMIYCAPYVLIAVGDGSVILWVLDPAMNPAMNPKAGFSGSQSATSIREVPVDHSGVSLKRPYMLRKLHSHVTGRSIKLSMRRVASAVIASIVFTVETSSGWCVGIQDLDICTCTVLGFPRIVGSRLAYALPIHISDSKKQPVQKVPEHPGSSLHTCSGDMNNEGHIRLRYSHPYLIAILPDNTLSLFTCYSLPNQLSISTGVRLWGHTSGISDTEITSRGKAVSISARGDEIRVWNLEGKLGGSSVEIIPRMRNGCLPVMQDGPTPITSKVGFDSETIVILKVGPDGNVHLSVYDFT